MKTSTMKMSRQWGNIGAGAAKKGLPVDAVLTKSESVNTLIRAGYAKGLRKMATK